MDSFSLIIGIFIGFGLAGWVIAARSFNWKIDRKQMRIREWPRKISLEERFWALVDKKEGCWIWKGNLDPSGYGRIGINGDIRLTHRVAWELTNGLVPPNFCVLHLCDNPPCVRPDHLFLGDRGDNARDMAAKGRQHVQQNPAAAPKCPSILKAIGEQNGNSRFKEQEIIEIRKRAYNGEKLSCLAKEFNTWIQTISAIVEGRTWKHLPILK